MYQCVLFDMDGTLVDSYRGIFHAYEWAFRKMKMKFPGDAFVRKAIGSTPLDAFERLCEMPPQKIQTAAEYYREYYSTRGKKEAKLYPGIPRLLERLRDAGCFLGTATLKRELFAREMLENFSIAGYFHTVCGMDERNTKRKADLIQEGRKLAGASKENTLLVGDSLQDALGAEEAGISFLAVTYGFGFQKGKIPKEIKAAAAADTVFEIGESILYNKGVGI